MNRNQQEKPGRLSINKLIGKQDAIKTCLQKLAVGGYDPVAYFTLGMSVKGKPEFQHHWREALWQFSTAHHREQFMKSPESYVPQFGGYCAYEVSLGKFFDGNPEVWKIVDKKLFLLGNDQIAEKWKRDMQGNIEKANLNWPKLIA